MFSGKSKHGEKNEKTQLFPKDKKRRPPPAPPSGAPFNVTDVLEQGAPFNIANVLGQTTGKNTSRQPQHNDVNGSNLLDFMTRQDEQPPLRPPRDPNSARRNQQNWSWNTSSSRDDSLNDSKTSLSSLTSMVFNSILKKSNPLCHSMYLSFCLWDIMK